MKGFLLGFGAIIIIAAAIVTALNYFHLLPSSKTNVFIKQDSSRNLPCPVKITPCPSPDILISSTAIANFQGLGYANLRAGTKVLSVASGAFQIVESTDSAHPNHLDLYIGDKDRKLGFEYLFDGKLDSPQKSGVIISGQPLAVLSDKTRKVGTGKDYNLVIYARKFPGGTFIKLTPASNGILLP